jgi:hypothetical protein
VTINVLRGLRDFGLSNGVASLIQANAVVGASAPGNFEALLVQDNGQSRYVARFSRNNANPALPWRKLETVHSEAIGPACLIQSDFADSPGSAGNFEALVLERYGLFYYRKDSSNGANPWNRGARVCPVTGSGAPGGAACLIESTFATDPSTPGHNFEALVPETGGAPLNLVHYWKDNNSDSAAQWNRGVVVTSGASASACFIQASSGNFEALVLEGNNLIRYWRDNSDLAMPWHQGETVSSTATGPGCIIEASWGRYEALVLEGSDLVHYGRDNSDTVRPWIRGAVVSSTAAAPASMIQSTLRTSPGAPGNLEVIVQEWVQNNSRKLLVAYWMDSSTGTWFKGFSV